MNYRNEDILSDRLENPENPGYCSGLKGANASGTCSMNGYGSVSFSAIFDKNIIKKIHFKIINTLLPIASAAAKLISSLVEGKDLFKSINILQKYFKKYFKNPTYEEKMILWIAENAFENLITDYLSKIKKNIYTKNPKTIAVAMSGGVDSSMAAKILKDSGWNIFGITMKIIPDNSTNKNKSYYEYYKKYIEPAKLVAGTLNIPHITIDLEKEFNKIIVNPFCVEYLSGKTPNPCVECNKFIKFGRLLDISIYLGASFIATGHYCRIIKSDDSGLFEVKKGIDKTKDQSYFFWKLNQSQVSQIKTPLGAFFKNNVSAESKKVFTFLKDKEESQDTCFVVGNKYQEFLKPKINSTKEGRILNVKGELIGYHSGYPFFTIGQRRGLGISHSKPLYVKKILPEANIIIAAEEKYLYEKTMNLGKVNFISGSARCKNFRADVRIRYKSEEKPAFVKIISKNRTTVTFEVPQKAITPGQSAVFYEGDTMIGGGIIY